MRSVSNEERYYLHCMQARLVLENFHERRKNLQFLLEHDQITPSFARAVDSELFTLRNMRDLLHFG